MSSQQSCQQWSFVNRTCDGRRPSILHIHRARMHKQPTVVGLCVENTRRQRWTRPSAFNVDRRLSHADRTRLCVQRDGQLGVRQRRAVHRCQLIFMSFVVTTSLSSAVSEILPLSVAVALRSPTYYIHSDSENYNATHAFCDFMCKTQAYRS